MSSTPIAMMMRKGSAFRYRSGSGLPNRLALRNRLSPIGGKRDPSSRLARKTTPRGTGTTPNGTPGGATPDRHDDEERQADVPLRAPDRAERLARIERRPRCLAAHSHQDAPRSDQHDHQEAWHQAADIEVVDGDARHDPVEDHRQRG